jgi:NAD+ kinase
MKIAVFGTTVSPEFISVLLKFFRFFEARKFDVQIYEPFYTFLAEEMNFAPYYTRFFHSQNDFDPENKMTFSIGGDGTFLQSVQNIRNFEVPVVGVNSGRLGFLADISQDLIINALNDIAENRYEIIERSLLEAQINGVSTTGFNLALNEATVLKTDNSSMIKISAYIEGEFLNTYWADGLIVATPTGSTAYSLSVGGPILTPGSQNFVITPISPHNLAIRPIVVPDHNEIRLEVSGRGSSYLASLDSMSMNLDFDKTITIRKAGVKLKTIVPLGHTFFNTLRNKLMWGLDKRN